MEELLKYTSYLFDQVTISLKLLKAEENRLGKKLTVDIKSPEPPKCFTDYQSLKKRRTSDTDNDPSSPTSNKFQKMDNSMSSLSNPEIGFQESPKPKYGKSYSTTPLTSPENKSTSIKLSPTSPSKKNLQVVTSKPGEVSIVFSDKTSIKLINEAVYDIHLQGWTLKVTGHDPSVYKLPHVVTLRPKGNHQVYIEFTDDLSSLGNGKGNIWNVAKKSCVAGVNIQLFNSLGTLISELSIVEDVDVSNGITDRCSIM